MSKKRFYFRNYVIIFIIVCSFLYIVQMYNNMIDISILEYDELEEVINTNGIIVKDEAIINSNCFGNAKYHYNEGQKVYKGAYLADISTVDSAVQINAEIELINKAMNSPENVIAIGSSESNKYSKYTHDELKALKASFEKALANNKVPVFSPKSGFVTYIFDGLEDTFKYDDVLNIMPSKLHNLEEIITNTKSTESVNVDDKLLKVINNFEYYMVCLVNNSNISTYKEDSYIRVRFDNDDEIVYGYIEKINSSSEESALIIRFDDFFYKVYNKRIVKAELIKNIYQGIKVDKKAVIEKDGITGVYIKDISNIIKFIPIEIIGSDDEFYMVSQGEIIAEGERGRITINDKLYSTVKAFDKVVLDPDKVYEGQIVD